MIDNALRGGAFFTLFLPSFTNLGFQARRWWWEPLVPDFSGQTWLVTGASGGIGREISAAAARAGAVVLGVARSRGKLDALAAELADAPGSLEPHPTDLSLIAETEALVDRLAGAGRTLDVLVNNVGLMLNDPAETAEGLDAAFVVNLLGHYVLTEELLGRSLLADGAAIINMSSGGMYNVPLDLDALQGGAPYDGTMAYARHKRAQVVLNRAWRERLGGRIASYVMHPGWVDTPGVATAMPEFHRGLKAILRDPAAGADTALWLAAKRPAQRDPEGIWFDRALRPAHVFPGTRSRTPAGALLTYLESQRNRVSAAA